MRISPPSSVRWAASASAMAWEPPSATGQPTACPAASRTSANEVVSRWSRGRKACAAHPANRAWASSVVNQVRPARDAGTSAGSPNRVQDQRVAGDLHERAGDHRGQVVPALGDRADPAPVGLGVRPEAVGGLVHRPVEHPGPSAVERVGEGELGLEPAQPVALERQLRQVGRAGRERVDGRADVVAEPGQGQLGRAGATADRVPALDDQHGTAGRGQGDRGRQAVGPRSDDDGVVAGGGARRWLPPALAAPAPWPGGRGTRRWR